MYRFKLILVILIITTNSCKTSKSGNKNLINLSSSEVNHRVLPFDKKAYEKSIEKPFHKFDRINDSVLIFVKPITQGQFSILFDDVLMRWTPSLSSSIDWNDRDLNWYEILSKSNQDNKLIRQIKERVKQVKFPLLKDSVDVDTSKFNSFSYFSYSGYVTHSKNEIYFDYLQSHPVVNVSKEFANNFCLLKSDLEKIRLYNSKSLKKDFNFYYRLPTPDEWVKALRKVNSQIHKREFAFYHDKLFKIDTVYGSDKYFNYQMNNISELTLDDKIAGLNYTDTVQHDPKNLKEDELVRTRTVESADWLGFRCVCVKKSK